MSKQAGLLEIKNNMKISVAEMRRMLPIGATFTAEFIGRNASRAKPEDIKTKRVVISQSSAEMVSRFVGRDRTATNIWKSKKVDKLSENEYQVSMILNDDIEDPYLKIILDKE